VLVQEESFKAFHKFVTGREMVPLQTEVLKVLAQSWVGRLHRGRFALVGSPAARANMVSQFLKHGCAPEPNLIIGPKVQPITKNETQAIPSTLAVGKRAFRRLAS
jgi:hypothetical protein